MTYARGICSSVTASSLIFSEQGWRSDESANMAWVRFLRPGVTCGLRLHFLFWQVFPQVLSSFPFSSKTNLCFHLHWLGSIWFAVSPISGALIIVIFSARRQSEFHSYSKLLEITWKHHDFKSLIYIYLCRGFVVWTLAILDVRRIQRTSCFDKRDVVWFIARNKASIS